MNRDTLIGGLFGLVAGITIGYFVGQKVTRDKYEAILDSEIADIKESFKEKYESPKSDEEVEYTPTEEDRESNSELVTKYTPDPEDSQTRENRVAARASILKAQEETMEQKTREFLDSGVPAQKVIEHLISEVDGMSFDDWQTAKMLEFVEKRTNEDYCYIISKEEIDEYKQQFDGDSLTLTYYAGDDTLTDSREKVIPDIEGILGPDAVDSFGIGSGDQNIVYVANFDREVVYEIIKDDREYISAVMGINDKKGPSKFREDD